MDISKMTEEQLLLEVDRRKTYLYKELEKLEEAEVKIPELIALRAKVAQYEDKGIEQKEGGNTFRPYAEDWQTPQFKVLEVTGMVGGLYVPTRWFKTSSPERAEEYLKTLDWGNVWVSDAWVSRYGEIHTGKRKRVRTLVCKCGESLKTPHPYCATKKQVRHIKPFITV